MKILVLCFFSVVFIILAVFTLMFFKNDNCYKNRKIILNAIYEYNIDAIKNRRPYRIDSDVMEEYDKTFYRLWDWGYKNIVPPDVLEKISPFIHK